MGGVGQQVSNLLSTLTFWKWQKLHDWSTRSQHENKGSPANKQTATNKTAIKTVNAGVWSAYVTINVTEDFKIHITYFIFKTKCLIITYRLFKQTIYAHMEALPVDLGRYVAANLLWRHHCTASFPAYACTFQQRRKHSAPHFKLFLISTTMALNSSAALES